ncbi:hypothetical protein KMT30_18910 [Streptomyces sp. IBSBF 2953]|uniref:hypothetical protein n=1 Tax=Streptomyces TaxID=1883 RepID=UPI00211A7121|nr:hypothetical protein [Streptomyces scabiei]MCQ9181075.1 hypothetical protein [Streptomyces hayashii]MDX3115947.1 hypothetical protein [Streptomyces scabiei]
MSANHKRLIAIAFCVLISLLLGFVCGLTAAVLGASPLAAVSGGGGATVSLLGVGVAAVALFDFADGGASASTPPGGAAAHAGVRR